MKISQYVGVFGNVSLVKVFCMECQAYSFVRNGETVCCDGPIVSSPELYKRESVAEEVRRLPPIADRRTILEEQQHCCFYCQRAFGSICTRNKKRLRLRCEWDHYVPFALLQDNRSINFVAACHVCNRSKADKCFQTTEEARLYIVTHNGLTD